MDDKETQRKSIDQLRKEWSEYFPPPRSAGEAVVVAFILKNLSSFKNFVGNRPKPLQVAAQRWVRDSLEEVRKSRMHSECANNFSLPNCFSEIPEALEWHEILKQEAELASRNLASASKNVR
jgi:hypothetical protein